MAWENWRDKTSTFGKNQFFKVDVHWRYRQDLITRQTEINVMYSEYIAIKGQDGGGGNIGYPDPATIIAGLGLNSGNYKEKTYTGVRIQSTYSQDGKYRFDLPDVTLKFKHNPNGKPPFAIKLWCKALFKTFVGAASSFDWKFINIENQIPNMAVLPIKPYGGSLQVLPGQKSATIKYDGFIFEGGLQKYEVAIGDSLTPFVDNGTKKEYTRSDLTPNTTYTAYVRAVDKFGQTSETLVKAFKTWPLNPEVGTVKVQEVSSSAVKVIAEGFTFGPGGDFGKYEFSVSDTELIKWIDNGASRVFTAKGLKPGTNYKLSVRLVDQYGQASEIATVSFKTLTDQAKIRKKKDGQWKTYKVWKKKNGQWKKVKRIWKKKAGQWKKGK